MAKIMLVEDDNNLREIYEARLLAEGYEIVSAKDGEEALALAVKEKPDLIISDVMMPKISGFDMLDILRGTEETKNTKVVMMTALSQNDDKQRAEKLGADRYLVKSQVTLEDVARVASEVLDGTSAPAAAVSSDTGTVSDSATTSDQTPSTDTTASDTIVAEPDTPTPVAPAAPVTPATNDSDLADSSAEEKAGVEAQINDFVAKADATGSSSTSTPPPSVPITKEDKSVLDDNKPADPIDKPIPATEKIDVATPPPSNSGTDSTPDDSPKVGGPEHKPTNEDSPKAHKKVISPINNPLQKPDLNALLAKEEAGGTAKTTDNPATTTTPGTKPIDPNNIAL